MKSETSLLFKTFLQWNPALPTPETDNYVHLNEKLIYFRKLKASVPSKATDSIVVYFKTNTWKIVLSDTMINDREDPLRFYNYY